MRAAPWLAVFLLSAAYTPPAPSVGGGKAGVALAINFSLQGASNLRCGAAADLVTQALERLQPQSSNSQVADADQLLKRAVDLCSTHADAYYYRSLVETKLGHAALARFAMDQAKALSSEALSDGVDPFTLSTPRSRPNVALPAIRQRWALVVGIGDFADKSIPSLAYTSRDAKAFWDVLVDPTLGGFKPENVRLLTDAGAKLSDIKKGVNWLARSAGPDDLVVVYVASHGSPRSVDTVGANYIIAHDTELGESVDPDALYASAYPMVELANAIATRLKSLRTAVFLDTCYSGGVIGGGKAAATGLRNASVSSATLETARQGTGRIIFAASRTEQQSLESAKLQHGYFTYYLVQALRDAPGAPLSRIFSMVQAKVSAQVDADYQLYGLHQTPVMSRSADDADFALGASNDATSAGGDTER